MNDRQSFNSYNSFLIRMLLYTKKIKLFVGFKEVITAYLNITHIKIHLLRNAAFAHVGFSRLNAYSVSWHTLLYKMNETLITLNVIWTCAKIIHILNHQEFSWNRRITIIWNFELWLLFDLLFLFIFRYLSPFKQLIWSV